MDTTLSKILGQAGLPEELTASLQEAFDKKVAEAREEAEAAIRAEFAQRYEADKNHLIEAIDLMIGDVAKEQAEANAAEIAKLKEARDRFRAAKAKCIREYRIRMAENTEASRRFVMEQVKKEVMKLREARKQTLAEKARLQEAIAEAKTEVAKKLNEHIGKIDRFVTKQVARELDEFAQDQRALVKTRLKLVAEGKKKLAEAQRRFIRESAKKVDKFVNETLRAEMSQLHEDLERNRQNMFGRRIFEAFAAEYLTSYLVEGTEIAKMRKVIEQLQTEKAETKAKLDEASKAIEAANRKAKLAEDRANRAKIMSELLSNLRGEKKAIMEGMLETVKTEALRASFDKLLPIVLNEGKRPAPASQGNGAKRVLSEQRITTGNQRVNPMRDIERIEQSEVETEIAQLVRRAGITI